MSLKVGGVVFSPEKRAMEGNCHQKHCYSEESFHFIFAVKEAETRTNSWILQEDKILTKELKAGHRGPAMEWMPPEVVYSSQRSF